MVFSSIPVYLDPSNWHQQQNHHLPLGGTTAAPGSEISHELPPLPAPPTLSHVGLGSGGVGIGQNSIRPNSMSDRARMAKIPQPETALKCPRCESTNTKFCYFNNYSLSQPRHFCKTCRRYWTRGGALRNVPVGGGCRRNKKSKSGNNNNNSGSSSGRSKSPAATATEHNQTGSNLMTNNSSDHHLSQLPLLASSIQGLGRYGGGGSMGLNFNEIHHGQPSDHQQHHHMGFQFHQIGGNNSMNNFNGGMLGGFQQLPFLGGGGGGGGFESSASNGLYPFHQASTDPMAGDNSRVGNDQAHDELAPPVKAEDSHGVRLTRPSLGTVISENNNNNQFWGGNLNAWTDLSGLNSSSTGHLL